MVELFLEDEFKSYGFMEGPSRDGEAAYLADRAAASENKQRKRESDKSRRESLRRKQERVCVCVPTSK